jgi:hypothetical protein
VVCPQHEAAEGIPGRTALPEGGFSVYCPRYKMRAGSAVLFLLRLRRFSYPEQYKLVKYTRGVRHVVGNDAGAIPLDDGSSTSCAAGSRRLIELEKYGVEPSSEMRSKSSPARGRDCAAFRERIVRPGQGHDPPQLRQLPGAAADRKSKLKKVLP